MSENKCPVCQEGEIIYHGTAFGPDYDSWHGCTNCHFQCDLEHLPRIAAAMELARAGVWAEECEEQRDYMDDTVSNRDAWRSIVNLDIDANYAACEALERCKEVFK